MNAPMRLMYMLCGAPRRPVRFLPLAILCAGLLTMGPASAGLVSHWTLDDAVGTSPIVDSVSGYDAFQAGSPALGVPGVAGTAGTFPAGANYYRTAPQAGLNLSEFTFSFWFNPLHSDGGYYNVAIANRDGENGFIIYQQNDSVQFWLRHTTGGWQAQSQPIVRGVDEWYHVAGSYDPDGGIKKFYVTPESDANATVDHTMSGATILLHGAGPRLGIGVRGDGGLPLNGGYIDDVQVYDVALSDQEVNYLFHNPGNGIPTWDGSVGTWHTASSWSTGVVPNLNGSDSAFIESGTVTYVPGGDFTINNGNTLHLGGTGTWKQDTTHWIRIGETSEGTVDQTGGTFDASAVNNIRLGFNASGVGNYNLDGGTLIVRSIDQGAGAANFSFGGGTLEAAVSFTTALPMTINDGGATIDTNANTVTLTGALSAGTGSGGLTKAGAGTLILSGNNTYSGGTLVDGGTLQAGNVNALGTGAATVNAGTTLDAAAFNIANDVTLNGGTLYTTNALSGTITLNNVPGNQIFANGNYRLVYGQITGAGGFTMGGINTPGLALANPANDFQGDVVVNGGSYLGVWASEVIPDTADVTVGGYLRLQGANRTETIAGLNGGGTIFTWTGGSAATLRVGANDASGSYSGNVGGSWDVLTRDIHLVKIGNGTQSLSGVLYHNADTTVDGGILRLNRGGVGFPSAGATGQFISAHTVTVESGATLQVNANWVMGDGLANKVVVNEGGTLEFLDSDNYFGNVELTGGAIIATGASRPWRTGNWGSGLITTNASAASSTIDGSLCFVGTAAAPVTVFDVADGTAADDLVVSALIYDHPGFERRMMLVKEGDGKMVLSAVNTFQGGVAVNGGTLSVNSLSAGNTPCALGASYGTPPYLIFDGGALEYTGGTVGGINRAFTINGGGATIDITNAAATVTWTDGAGAGPIIGTGLFTKAGDGTLVFAGNNAYSGGTLVDGGTLQAGNVNAFGTGAATVNAGATLDLAGYNVANDITLNGGTLWTANGASGTITLNNVAGNTINANGNYRVLSGQITGAGGFTFGGINTPGLALSNPANNFQGDIVVNPGSYLGVWASEVIPDTASLSGGGQLRLQGDGRTETIAGLSDGGRVFAANNGVGATLRIGAGDATSTYSGWIGGGGANNKNISLVKIGGGTLTLTGSLDYTGTTTVDGGTLRLARGGMPFPGTGATGQFTSPHTVTVNAGGTLQFSTTWVTGDGVANKVVVNEGGTLEFLNSDNYMGNIELTGGAIVTTGGDRPWRTGYRGNGLITTHASGVSSTIDGSLCFVGNAAGPQTTFDVADGAAPDDLVMSARIYDHPGFEGGMTLIKDGAGTMVLGGPNTYGGPTNVNQGTLVLHGTHTGGGAYTVASGATLGGTGSTTSALTVQGGGTLAPDGDLGTGSLDLEPLSFLEIGLDALTVFDSATVTGTVDVQGANLAVALGYAPNDGDYFVIVDNDGTADAVIGTFLGLPEGGRIFPGEPYGFWITYQGGDGNDIALRAVPEPATLALLGLGLLAVARRRRKR